MPQDPGQQPGFLARLQSRGVPRVAVGYAVIAWLLLQIGDVVLDPLDAPAWVMRALIFVLIAGFPVSLLLAWFLELGPDGITVDQLPEAAQRPQVSGLRRYADLVIIVILTGVIAVLLARQEGLLQPEPETPVLAVLPFSEIGKNEIGYFGAGLADTLSSKLGQLQQLVVLASASTRQFADAQLNLEDVGSKLGATSLLLGTVQRAGGLLRVNARLVDPRSGQQLWTQSYDREATDLFAVQDEIAQAVTRSLALVLTPAQSESLAKEPTNNLTAYEAYLRARDDLASRDYERLTSALRYLRDAIALDPDYALAHANLPLALHLAAAYRGWDTRWLDVRDEAQQAAHRATELDPRLGEAWFAHAMVMIGDLENDIDPRPDQEQLLALLNKAMQLSPSNSAILKQLSTYTENPDEKIALLQQAARIDPRSGIIRANLGEGFAERKDYQTAEDWYLKAALSNDPYFPIGYKQIIALHREYSGRLDHSARWGRAVFNRYPEEFVAIIEYSRTLLELGAWDTLAEFLEMARKQEIRGDAVHWARLLMQVRLARAQGRYEEAAPYAEEFIREFMISHAGWPDLTEFQQPYRTVFETLALHDIKRGQPETALARYLEGYSNPLAASPAGYSGDTLRAPVMMAALLRLTGDEAAANDLFQAVLSHKPDEGVREPDDLDQEFTRFTVFAFLGETDAAIDALEHSIEAGWVLQWWGLKDAAAFDANYAAVVADPRFQMLYEKIVGRVTAMRESFESNPDLPLELLQKAKLVVPSD
jgi:TolB-like protein